MLGRGGGNGWKELKSPKLGCYKSLKTIQATGWNVWRARVSLRPVHCHPRTHPPRVIQAAPQEPLQVQAACFLDISSINTCIPEAFLARMKLLHEKKKAGWRTNHVEAWQDLYLGDWSLSFTALFKVPQTQKAYQSQPGYSHFPDIHLEDRGGGDLSQGWCSVNANLTILPSPWSRKGTNEATASSKGFHPHWFSGCDRSDWSSGPAHSVTVLGLRMEMSGTQCIIQ